MEEKGQNNSVQIEQQYDDLEERYEKYREILKNLTIMSDVFMRNVLKKKECTEYVIQTILSDSIHVLDQTIQKDYKNLQGRSAIMDCVAKDDRNRMINVEIQQEKEGASPKRARYHSGLVDMNTLNPGEDFDELPENYVIFITRSDVLGQKKQIYHIDRRVRETGEAFGDDTYIVYVNGGMQNDTEVGRLVHDLHCRDAKDIYSKVLAQRVYELKETQEGIEVMCKEMDEIYHDGMNRGIECERKNTERERDRADKEKERADRAEFASNNMMKLTTLLLKSGRVDDCLRAANDVVYQQQLLKELGIA